MKSINDVEEFEISEHIVGQVGYGYVGQAVEALFKERCKVVVYDKFKIGTESLSDVVKVAHVIFVAVPTPMKSDGECHTGIVEEVLQEIQTTAANVGRDLDEFVVVLKSTVPPGFTRSMQKKFALRILFSPEFLTEANSVDDFKNARRVLLGGREEDALVVAKFFEAVWPDRMQVTTSHPAGPVIIVQCDPEVAEMVKLFTNAILTIRVIFGNEIYKVCEALGIDYDEVRMLACLDRRINSSHLFVPGPDGDLGFGGHCFVKDVNNLKYLCSQLGTGEKLFTAVLSRNDELRTNRNWEKMVNRAVLDIENKS